MNKHNANIHHRQSIRLQGYNYSRAGLYFITICCHNKMRLFGEITSPEYVGVEISGVDFVGAENLQPLLEHPMRNQTQHGIHGSHDLHVQPTHHVPNKLKPIMVLNDAGKIADECWAEIPKHFPNVILHEHVIMPNHVHGIIELINDIDDRIQNPRLPFNIANQNKYQKVIPRSIGAIIRGYKTGVTKWFRNNTDTQIVWQRNFHERIIRDEESYQSISNYIRSNPAKWNEGKFYK